MKITSYTRADQLVPVSRARDSLPSLIKEVAQKDFFVLVRKYQPRAALVDLEFFTKLMEIYEQWKRKQDFAVLDKIRQSIPEYKSSEIEQDIKDALKAVRNSA